MDFALLRNLTETSGVPGYEHRIRDLVRDELAAVADDVRSDAMGNLIVTVEGASPEGTAGASEAGRADYEVLVGAHMDEIGFMVRHVHEDGFLEIDALGGWDPRVLKANRVTVHTDGGDLPGVIGSPPPHTLDEDDEDDEVEDHYVDLGLPVEEVEERVSVGDPVTMAQETTRVGDAVTGKALDDRVCLYALVEAAKRADPAVTVHYAATVQEEVGLRGARALGVDLDPNLAVALDVTVANDIPQIEEEGDYVTRLGEGAAIKVKDGSVITSPRVHRRMRDVAESRSIRHQLEVLPSGGTDTAGFQTEGGAKPVGAISVPTRYLHTVTETANVADVEATIDLLVAFLETETGEHDYRL
jgi:endoglucanase